MNVKTILKLEEAAMFAVGWWVAMQGGLAWWWFWMLLLTPDVGMVGYLFGPRAGAFLYNLFHHKAIAIGVATAGWWYEAPLLLFTGGLLFAHSSMDRVFGYGLKYITGFKDTHLGRIG